MAHADIGEPKAMDLRGDDLAYATLDYIREHPEEWNQSSYFSTRRSTACTCRSTTCFAGRALLLAGEQQPTKNETFFTEDIPAGHPSRILGYSGCRARRLLGWSVTQAAYVFLDNTKDFTILEERVKRVLNGEVE